MKNSSWILGLILGCSAFAASAAAPNIGGAPAVQGLQPSYLMDPTGEATRPVSSAETQAAKRADLEAQIVAKWGNHVQEAYKVSAQDWSGQIAPFFKAASLGSMQRALSARNFSEMNGALSLDGVKTGGALRKLLGEITNDLVYVPVTPCRLFDTRLAGGVITAGTTRNFDITAVTDYSFQGGDASNCNGVGSAGSFAAAAINFTVVFPIGQGFITAYPFLATRPTAATMVYRAGDLLSNTAIVKLDQGASANELSVYSANETHLVGDIVGYFVNPELGPIDCVETVSSNINVNANSTGTGSSPACAAGYTIISGGCTMSTFDGRVVSSRSFPNTNTHFCAFRNENVSAANTGLAYGRCCKLPSGR